MNVRNKVAIITGGGSGIGQACCYLLAEHGANIVVTDINIEAAKATALAIQEKGSSAIYLKHDVASEADWQSVIAKTKEAFGAVDILVNNAGIALSADCKDTSLSDWSRVISVNMDGVFLGVREVLKAMLQGSGKGSIINISSVHGLVGGGTASYSASKGGVAAMTKSLAAECGRCGYGIRVNSVHPGAINTPMAYLDDKSTTEEKLQTAENLRQKIPMGRFAEPIEVAQGVLFLASDASSYITGTSLVIDGGYTAV